MAKGFTYEYVKGYIETQGYILLSKKYINTHSKLQLECPKGHKFEMAFNNFKRNQRCPICARENQNRIPKKPNNKKYSQEYIQKIVNAKNCILLEPYVNKRTKLKLQCPNGHKFEIRLDSFQRGDSCGCRQCMANNMMHDEEFVINKLKERDIILLSKYEGNNIPMTLQCEHGHIFSSTYDIVVNNNCGCSICNESKGEKKVKKYLEKTNIDYEMQYRFKDCKFKYTLPFDFYLPKYNCCIEFDGKQHYQIVKHFGGLDEFIDTKIRDTIKNIYCQQNNIKLIRIPYWDYDKIEEILNKELF